MLSCYVVGKKYRACGEITTTEPDDSGTILYAGCTKMWEPKTTFTQNIKGAEMTSTSTILSL